jgi:DNA polymerase I
MVVESGHMAAVKTEKKASSKSSTGKKRLVVLDTHAILHRAYHAMPDFSSSKGEPTGALYGLISMLVRIFGELKPDYIAAAFDLPKATHRHEAFEGYKATRQKTDDALVAQIERSRDVLRHFAIPLYEAPGFEADDVLGTVVEKLKKDKNVEIIIASGDMDTLQLVSGKKVQVYTIKKGINDTILYDEGKVQERFGFGPEYIADYKGFRGDPSDNIPGVKGIGEKTATALITAFGGLDDVYKALKKDVAAARAKAGLTERLANLLLSEEEEARFSKMLAQIRLDAPITFALPEKSWKENIKLEELMELLTELEFRSLMPRVRALLGAPALEEVKEEEEVPQSFDPEAAERAKLALWVVDSNYTAPSIDDVLRFTKTKSLDDALSALESTIKRDNLSFVYEKVELPLMPILRTMERHGVCVDNKELARLAKEYRKELEILERRIYEAAGEEFNINSPRQLGEILFTKLSLGGAKQKKTSTGQLSTRESELEKLRDTHPIVGDILSYRELAKLLSTYIESIPKQVDAEGRLHSSFVQTGTTTGRVSSRDPNLQNIPIKSELGRAIRNAFVAPEGYELVAFDYSQIDLRVAAFLSEDPKLIEIFTEDRDVHAAVAAQVFGIPEREVTKEMRRRAKVINFGILYGMGVSALQQNLGTSRKEAQEFYQNYFETFSRLAEYLEEVKAKAAKQGYVETFFGRRRYFEGIRSSIPYIRASAERMAINAPIQGTQADILKLAMIEIDKELQRPAWKGSAHLLLQVHDEVIYEVKKELVAEIAPVVRRRMQEMMSLKDTKGVPLKAKASKGLSWGTLEDYEC